MMIFYHLKSVETRRGLPLVDGKGIVQGVRKLTQT